MAPPQDIVADAVIFDMDGTLIDSTALVEAVWAAFADRHGVDLGTLLAYAHGRRAEDTVEHFLAAGPAGEGDADIAAATAAVHEHETGAQGGVREIPGAAAFVSAFDPADVALVTSAPRALARLRMAESGVTLPAIVVGADDVSVGKPDPEGYLRAAELLGRDPSRVVIFEDADAGIRAARASGAQVVVVGAFEGEATEGLPRISDYTTAAVTRSHKSGYRIGLSR
ncbi:HAD-IA family hydrolase [Herbiconiux sp. P17]|uniref:HAD-IA family hydrolase n=1 Tax=Herbiconiux wuyangfengii TaxID=3342794 RepID=UPI0035B70A44